RRPPPRALRAPPTGGSPVTSRRKGLPLGAANSQGTDRRSGLMPGTDVLETMGLTMDFRGFRALDDVDLRIAEGMIHAIIGPAGRRLGYAFWRSDRVLDQFTDEAVQILTSVGLDRLANRPAAALPYGQKRALEIGLTLALRPRLLLLDEPTAGLSLEDVARIV